MVSLEKMRGLLQGSEKMCDEEVLRIRETMVGFADAIFDKWLKEKNKKRISKV